MLFPDTLTLYLVVWEQEFFPSLLILQICLPLQVYQVVPNK